MGVFDIFVIIWKDFLLIPFYNILIIIYQTIGFNSMGLAIIELTVLLRIIMIPATLSTNKTEAKLRLLEKDIEKIESEEKDEYKRKQAIKRLFDEKDVDPYSDLISLFSSAFFFILIYQAVNMAFDRSSFQYIYSFLPVPESINTEFLGIDMTKPNLKLDVFSSLMLFVLLVYSQKSIIDRKAKTFSERWHTFLYPIFIFIIKMQLSSAKVLFFTTSFIFSIVFKVFFELTTGRKLSSESGDF